MNTKAELQAQLDSARRALQQAVCSRSPFLWIADCPDEGGEDDPEDPPLAVRYWCPVCRTKLRLGLVAAPKRRRVAAVSRAEGKTG